METTTPLPQVDKADGATLSKLRAFAELSELEMRALVARSTRVRFASGERILAQGDEGHAMYVILQGRVRVLAQGVELAVLKEGDFFGEVSLIDDGPRSADVVAMEACEMLSVTRMTLGLLAAAEPGVAIHLLAAVGRSLVSKLRADHARFQKLILLAGGPSVRA